MRNPFVKGVLLGSLVAAIVMMAGTALAGSGIGALFNLGETNSVDEKTTLSGATYGKRGQPPLLQVTNTGNKPALGLTVQAGTAPLIVNSTTKVANLNADAVDGLHASDLTQEQQSLAAQVTELQGQVDSLSSTVSTLQSRLAVVEDNEVLALGPFVTVSSIDAREPFGASLTFTGINLYAEEKSGETYPFPNFYYVRPRGADPQYMARLSNPLGVWLDVTAFGISLKGFKLFRSVDSDSPGIQIADLPATQADDSGTLTGYRAEYKDYDVQAGQTYYYTAIAYDAWGVEGPSGHVCRIAL